MIVVCEPICWGLEHVPVNAGLLEVLRLAVPTEKIIFCGEQSHLRHVSAQIKPELASSINWKVLKLPPRHTEISSRWIPDYKLMKYITGIIGKKSSGHVVLTCSNSASLVALKILIGFVYRTLTAHVVFHGNLSQLNGWRSRNPITRIHDLRTALAVPDGGKVRYIVLEETIKKEMLKRRPSLEGRVDVLNHPVPSNEGDQTIGDLSVPIQFGFLGLATEEKGFPFYLKIASEISKRYPKCAEFHAIGFILDQLKNQEMSVLASKPDLQKMSREQFIHRLKELHFVCLPYQRGHYDLSASGVLLDAIVWEKPLVAMRIPLFENLFSKFGDIGYLCDTETEFLKAVDEIIENQDNDRYRKQILTLRKIKKSRTPKFLSSKYRELYENLRIK